MTENLLQDKLFKRTPIKNLHEELFGKTETIEIFTDNKASKSSIEAGHLNPKLRYISV